MTQLHGYPLFARPRRLPVMILLLALTGGATGVAVAGPQEPAEQSPTPAALADEGVVAYEDGNYPTAVAKLASAYQSLRAPSVGLWLGRALVMTGKLVEAAAILHEVQQLSPEVGKAEVQKRAQLDAAGDEAALLLRLPKLTLQFRNPVPDKTMVYIDGRDIELKRLAEPQPVNPGQHGVTLDCSTGSRIMTVTLNEGEAKWVPLECAPPTAMPKSALDHSIAPNSLGATTSPESDRPKRDSRGANIATWATLGLGAAGLVFGSVSGVVALSKKGDLNDRGCHDERCPASVPRGDVESLNDWRHVSTAGFLLGSIGVAAGATLWLTAPKNPNAGRAALTVGLQSLAFKGEF